MERFRRPLRALAFIGAGGALLALLGFVEYNAARTPLSDLRVEISGAPGLRFLDEATVRNVVLEGTGLIGTPVGEVDVTGIEERLRAIGSVGRADAYRTMDGVLHVRVEQREPIARVLNADGSGFYLTREGHTMPLSNAHTARVLVFTGPLHEPFHQGVTEIAALDDSLAASTHLADMWSIARTITGDPFWDAMIDQVAFDPMHGFELIPRVGAHRVRIGDGARLPLKLANLRSFYDQGITQTDWRRYSIIDLRFGDQVVCTKRNT